MPTKTSKVSRHQPTRKSQRKVQGPKKLITEDTPPQHKTSCLGDISNTNRITNIAQTGPQSMINVFSKEYSDDEDDGSKENKAMLDEENGSSADEGKGGESSSGDDDFDIQPDEK